MWHFSSLSVHLCHDVDRSGARIFLAILNTQLSSLTPDKMSALVVHIAGGSLGDVSGPLAVLADQYRYGHCGVPTLAAAHKADSFSV